MIAGERTFAKPEHLCYNLPQPKAVGLGEDGAGQGC